MNTIQRSFKIGICQLKATENKPANLFKALAMTEHAKHLGAECVVFGEMFCQPYEKSLFQEYSEAIPRVPPKLNEQLNEFISKCKSQESLQESSKAELLGLLQSSAHPTYSLLQFISRHYKLLVIGGSLCESCDGDLYNTCYVFDLGEQVGKHRKVHLFDIDIPGQITFKESEVLKAGSSITLIKTRLATFGVGICYDIRFAEYAMALRKLGAEVLVYPSVFNMVTGPRHYHVSGQARSVDTQCYTILASTARYEEKPQYMQSFGHSALIDFDGKVLSHLGKEEGVLIGDIDLEKLEACRKGLPYTSGQQKSDVYELIIK